MYGFRKGKEKIEEVKEQPKKQPGFPPIIPPLVIKATTIEGAYRVCEREDGKLVFNTEHKYSRGSGWATDYSAEERLGELCRNDYRATGNCNETRRLFAGTIKEELGRSGFTIEEKADFVARNEIGRAKEFFDEIEKTAIKKVEFEKSEKIRLANMELEKGESILAELNNQLDSLAGSTTKQTEEKQNDDCEVSPAKLL